MTSALTHTETRMYVDSCYCKSIGYVLGQSFFTEKEIQALEQDAMRAFTSKMGFDRNMKYAIWEDPYHLAGAAITSFINIQGIGQIKNFRCHIQTDTDIGKC
eukprot:14037050-Ditylum_brightwellii.AAC.1